MAGSVSAVLFRRIDMVRTARVSCPMLRVGEQLRWLASANQAPGNAERVNLPQGHQRGTLLTRTSAGRCEIVWRLAVRPAAPRPRVISSLVVARSTYTHAPAIVGRPQ